MDFLQNISVTGPIIGGGILIGVFISYVLLRFLGSRNVSEGNGRIITRHLKLAIYFGISSVTVFILLFVSDIQSTSNPLITKAFQILSIVFVCWLLIKLTNVFEEVMLKRYDITLENNMQARKVVTQLKFIKQIARVGIVIIGIGLLLLSFDRVREFGTGLLTSAGILSIIIGFAAQRSLANLLAGVELAFTQPVRIDDAVVVENEWGWIEEINLTYVVIRLWDWRRLILPITYLIQNPFQNWTRNDSRLLGSVFIYTDYRMPMQELRKAFTNILDKEPLWDRQTSAMQVTDANERTIQIRVLMSARNSGQAFDLRCIVREKLIDFIATNYPEYLPTTRVELKNLKDLSPNGKTPVTNPGILHDK